MAEATCAAYFNSSCWRVSAVVLPIWSRTGSGICSFETKCHEFLPSSPYRARSTSLASSGVDRSTVQSVPDLCLWRPLGNNVIEKSSTSWAYQLKLMIVRTCIAYASIQNGRECCCCTNSNNTSYLSYCLQTRHVSTFALSKVSDEIYVFKFWKWTFTTAVGDHDN